MNDVSPEVEAITEACEAIQLRFSKETEGVYVTFCIQLGEVPAGLAESKLRSRWMLAMVQIGDDEKPVPKPITASKRKRLQNSNVMRAAILCNDKDFQKFLSKKYTKQWHAAIGNGQEAAAEVMRGILGIDTRKDIGVDPQALAGFDRLDAEYLMWKKGA